MNTVKSFWLGWGSVCVAGGGAYYFAKRQINADRQSKLEEHRRKRYEQQSYEYASHEGNGASNSKADTAGSPSYDAPHEPAPTGHPPPKDDGSKNAFQGKVPYRSPKGDRFS